MTKANDTINQALFRVHEAENLLRVLKLADDYDPAQVWTILEHALGEMEKAAELLESVEQLLEVSELAERLERVGYHLFRPMLARQGFAIFNDTDDTTATARLYGDDIVKLRKEVEYIESCAQREAAGGAA